ncbi:hypothetical protein DFP81_11325 [Marinomonas pollencensis]|uniref:Uncharacterized protein n=1 Tax=Marinomonas pollencensis TaxID=491954 RepID=A0A3E0DHP1_9GAMM|nr:hypothetical protein DFP81_11325 [Marinomonas pollencensis]
MILPFVRIKRDKSTQGYFSASNTLAHTHYGSTTEPRDSLPLKTQYRKTVSQMAVMSLYG